MTHGDIMAYLRHGDNVRDIRTIIDSMVKDGYEKTIKTFRTGNADDKKEAQTFLENVIKKHKSDNHTAIAVTQKRGKTPAKASSSKTPSMAARIMNSAPVKDFTYPRNILHTGQDFKGLARGVGKTAKGAGIATQGAYLFSSGLMSMTIGTAQFAANAVAIARKSIGISDAVWGLAAIALVAQAINWTAIEQIDVPIDKMPALETHDDSFCADPGNLRGNALSAVFSRAHYAPGSSMHPHYKSALQGEKVGIPPIALMMVQAMETGFYDVQGSGDAQGLYQNQILDFLEKTKHFARDTPLYRDVSQKIAANEPVSEHDLALYDTLNTVFARLDNTTPGERIALRDDLSDGRLTADERAYLDLRNDGIFMGQLMGVYLRDTYPQLRTENLPADPRRQLDAVKETIYDVYQDHLMGPTGALYYNALKEIEGLKISDSKTVQNHADRLKADGLSPYAFNASGMWHKAEQNPGPFAGLTQRTTYADGYESFTNYIDDKTQLVTTPVQRLLDTFPAHTAIRDAFAVCVKADASGKTPEPLKTTRLQLARDRLGL